MEDILISVIVPAYNIAPYISRCLDSLLNQTYENIEIIVVDDGSTDETSKIIDKYAQSEKKIKAIHKLNQGVSIARITGIENSLGQYIGFVDGDDWIEPDMFEMLVRNAIHYNADISHCGYQMDFPDGHSDLYYGTGKVTIQNHEQGVLDLISGQFVEPGLWNKLYRREMVIQFEASPIWDSSIKINEDLLMNYILFSRSNKAVFEDQCKYHYTLRKNSAATSRKNLNKIIDPIKVMKIILEDTRLNNKFALLAYERLLRALMLAAEQEEWDDESLKAIYELKEQKKNKLFGAISPKLRLMVYGVIYSLTLYKLVRKIHGIISGNNKKYKID